MFVQLAQEQRDWGDVDEVSLDPQAAYDQAVADIAELGWRIQKKPHTGNERLDGFSTTLPGVIFVAVDFDEMPLAKRVWLLHHETVHVRQYKRHGADVFLATYATVPEGRWAFEVAAYAVTFQLMLRYGEKPEAVRRAIEDRAVSLHDKYELSPMPECTQATSQQIWLEATGLATAA